MQWEMLMKTQRNQNLGAIFSLLWCYVFFSFVLCWMKGKKCVVIIFHHPQPPWLSFNHPTQVDLCCIHFVFYFYFLNVQRCMFLHISSHRSVQHGGVMLSPASADRTDKKLVPNVGEGTFKSLHIIALRRLLLDHLCRGGEVDTLGANPPKKGSVQSFSNPKPFHQRFSGIFSFKRWLEICIFFYTWGNNLKSIFLARWKLTQRQTLLVGLLIVIIFVQTMHSLCLWPLVSTTESLQQFIH